MLPLVVPSIPCDKPVLAPITVLGDEILKGCRIRPEPQNTLKIRNVDSGKQVTQLDVFLLLGMGNEIRNPLRHS